MRNFRKSGVTALTAGIALAIGAVPVAFVAPAIVAGGQTSTIGAGATPVATAGTLTLATTSDRGTVTWSESDELGQSFTGGQFCEISEAGGSDDLLVLSGTVGAGEDERDGVAGFRGGDIGVFEFENASQCFRVDAGSFTTTETLSLKLGGDLSDGVGNLLAESATVELAKQPGSLAVTWTALLDGKPVGSDEWASPKRGNETAVATTQIAPAGAFDEVHLTATSGSFSLRGASFDLVSLADATFCDPGTVNDGSVPGAVNTLTEDNTTVTYIGNVTGTASCFGVRLTSGADDIQFLKPLDVARDAQFIFDTDWTLDTLEGGWTPDVALPAIFIDFELRDVVAEHELPFCDARLFDDGGNLVGTAGEDVPPWLAALDMETANIPGAEGTQYACIGSRDVSALADNTVTDQIYLIGDARMRW